MELSGCHTRGNRYCMTPKKYGEKPILRIASYPDLDKLKANPYWGILKEDITRQGYENVTEARFTLRWLWNNRKNVRILHFHYVHQFYEYELHYAKFLWVIRFARNLIIAKILGYRLVFTLHDLTPTFPLLPEWVNLLGYKIIVSLADRVIVHCDAARHLLKTLYYRKKNVITVAHPSFDNVYPNNFSRQDARTQLGLDQENFVFTFFGGIRPNKGLDELILTFRNIEDSKIRLIIAGAPFPPQEYIEQLNQLSRSDNRIRMYVEFIPDQDVQMFMNASDVIVLPFARILTSSSAMLALTFGKPVIVPRIGCLPELIGNESGWLYSPDAKDGLYSAMRAALQDDIKQKGIHARAIADRYRNVSLAKGIYTDFNI